MPAETLGMKVGKESPTGNTKRLFGFKVLRFRELPLRIKEP